MSGTLQSPGVLVTVTDESQYGSAGPGTVPLIFIATAANKASPTGTGLAPGSVPSAAGVLYYATSQRDAIQQFGNPTFTSYQGTVVQGDELSEYGLHCAYSYLGISNAAYLLRADIDTSQLVPAGSAPVGPPINGTYWLDLTNTQWGLFVSNGNSTPGLAWVPATVLVPTTSQVDLNTFAPLSNVGSNGNYAVVPWTTNNFFYQKINGAWVLVGSSAWQAFYPTVVTGTVANPASSTGTIVINGLTTTLSSNSLSQVVTAINLAMSATEVVASISGANALVITNNAGTGLTISGTGNVLTTLGLTATTIAGAKVNRTSGPAYPGGSNVGDLWVKGNPANNGAAWVVKYYSSTTGQFTALSAPFYPFHSALADGNSGKDAAAVAALGSNPTAGSVYIGYDATTGVQQIRIYTGSWSTLSETAIGATYQALQYEADFNAPTTLPAAGTYYYNATPLVDIMVSDGQQWLGYRNSSTQFTGYVGTDPNGPILSGSAPSFQSGGQALVDNDIWVDTSDLENYPAIYRWTVSSQSWNLVDNTDHTTPFGIVFADARANSGVTYTGDPNISNTGFSYNSVAPSDMVQSNFIDPDCPLADEYPQGMLLFNTRFSTGNVKAWTPTYFTNYDNTNYTITSYTPNPSLNVTFPPTTAARWVTASGLAPNGTPYMMRKAQRIMIVNALNAQINDNQEIRAELIQYNLIAAPGYPECLAELDALNTDTNQVAFTVGDTPIRLASDSNSILNWATNTADVPATGEDGLTLASDYVGLYYPWGLGQNFDGSEVMVPPSTMALRVMAYNDQVAYPWFAPAGFTRGLVTNATSVGYLNSNGVYNPVILNQGQRDTIYSNNINPIAYIPNRGLVVYGQKTLAPVTSAMDRVNVVRLVNYIAYNLDVIVKPYLFEQNDSITQTAALNTVSRFLNSLVGLRGLADYAVVCDGSNNTPDRVAQNQLWINVAIQPINAVEFIYIPVVVQSQSAPASINNS